MAKQLYDSPSPWEERLATGALTPEEWQILQEMVSSGEADSLEEAARMMDFEERDRSFEDSFEAL